MSADPPPVIIVHVKLLGFLKQFSDQTELELPVGPGSTLRGLIHQLADRLGEDFRRAVLDRHGNLNGGVALVLDREPIPPLKISEIPVWKDSDLLILPLIEGGQTDRSCRGSSSQNRVVIVK